MSRAGVGKEDNLLGAECAKRNVGVIMFSYLTLDDLVSFGVVGKSLFQLQTS